MQYALTLNISILSHVSMRGHIYPWWSILWWFKSTCMVLFSAVDVVAKQRYVKHLRASQNPWKFSQSLVAKPEKQESIVIAVDDNEGQGF